MQSQVGCIGCSNTCHQMFAWPCLGHIVGLSLLQCEWHADLHVAGQQLCTLPWFCRPGLTALQLNMLYTDDVRLSLKQPLPAVRCEALRGAAQALSEPALLSASQNASSCQRQCHRHPSKMGNSKSFLHAEDSALQLPAGKLLVVALANIAGLQKVTQFALEHLWQPGDAIHEIYVEDSSAAGEPDISLTGFQQGAMRSPWLGMS